MSDEAIKAQLTDACNVKWRKTSTSGPLQVWRAQYGILADLKVTNMGGYYNKVTGPMWSCELLMKNGTIQKCAPSPYEAVRRMSDWLSALDGDGKALDKWGDDGN